MDAGKANHYDDAVEWLRRARDAYRSAGRQADWQALSQRSIRTEHGRKYKLMGLLKGCSPKKRTSSPARIGWPSSSPARFSQCAGRRGAGAA